MMLFVASSLGLMVWQCPAPADPAPADPTPADPTPAPAQPDPAPVAQQAPAPPAPWNTIATLPERYSEDKKCILIPREFISVSKKVREFSGKREAIRFLRSFELKENEYYFAWVDAEIVKKPTYEQSFLVSVGKQNELIVVNSITSISRKLKKRVGDINWVLPI
eukprot:g63568.t1